ncbi:MAG: hypothetical protein GXO45_05245, partial [Aquificae bacterium]|nr:hypothetical protein [Aquificota bacterium]
PFYTAIFQTVYRYKDYILLTVGLLMVLSVAFLHRFLVKGVPTEVKRILSIKLDELKDIKKLFPYVYTNKPLLEEYLQFLEDTLYRGKVETEGVILKSIQIGERQITPAQLYKRFKQLRDGVIHSLLAPLSKRRRIQTKVYLFIHDNFGVLLLVSLFTLASGILHLFAQLYPKEKPILIVINILFFVALLVGIKLLKKPMIKVRDG